MACNKSSSSNDIQSRKGHADNAAHTKDENVTDSLNKTASAFSINELHTMTA